MLDVPFFMVMLNVKMLDVVMMSVVMLNGVILNIVMLNGIMMIVVAPFSLPSLKVNLHKR